jgi:hypothetical protein
MRAYRSWLCLDIVASSRAAGITGHLDRGGDADNHCLGA